MINGQFTAQQHFGNRYMKLTMNPYTYSVMVIANMARYI